MRVEEKLILAGIRKVFFDGDDREIADLFNRQNIDWERFKTLLIYHELTPYMYTALKGFSCFLPETITEDLKKNYYFSLKLCQQLWKEFLRLSAALKQENIGFVPIKGMAFLEDIYRELPARPMTDLDLLVKVEDLKKAEALFSKLGYEKELYGLKEEYWRRDQYHFAFFKNGKMRDGFIELHWALDYKRKNRDILPELWKRLRVFETSGGELEILSPEDNLFSLALHNRRFGKVLCLKNILDASLLLKKYYGVFLWDYVLEEAKKGRMSASVYFLLFQAKAFFGEQVPESFWKKLKVGRHKRRIIERFIEKNTFLVDSKNRKVLFLKSHFLLFDSFLEPIDYILNIPQEQFAKYYGLNPYGAKTKFLYRLRFPYMLLNRTRENTIFQ